jgi:hypothetical protein
MVWFLYWQRGYEVLGEVFGGPFFLRPKKAKRTFPFRVGVVYERRLNDLVDCSDNYTLGRHDPRRLLLGDATNENASAKMRVIYDPL